MINISNFETTQPTGGGGVQKMVKPFFEHHPPKITEYLPNSYA
jgi:hypothetical protein